VALYLNNGAITRPQLDGMCQNVQDSDGKAKLPLTCVCHNYQYEQGDWQTIIEWYEPPSTTIGDSSNCNMGTYHNGEIKAEGWLDDDEAWTLFSAARANNELQDGSYLANATSFKTYTNLLEDEYDGKLNGSVGCGKSFHRFLLDKQHDDHWAAKSCRVDGVVIARSQTFLTAVYCEMMRAYTVRCAPGDGSDPPWMWEVFMRNNWLHLACSISFWLTIFITLVPGVQTLFKLSPPPFYGYLIGIAFPIVNAILDEFVPKPIYKYFIVRRRKARATVKG